jgi:disulfide bond formation protein DsbB
MDVAAVTFVYGVLAIVGIVTLIWLGVMALASRFSGAVHYGFEGLRERATPYALLLAFTPALLATLGSLYFSEIAHYAPCTLCWYQRIAMYPLVLLLGIAAWRRDLGIRVYAIPLATIGALISVYHYLLEWFPDLDAGACTVGIPCTQVWFRQFGFISMPLLALIAFLLVIASLLLAHRGADDAEHEADGPEGD